MGALLAFFLLSASSCATTQTFTDSGAPKIAFVGDSITVQSTVDINAHYSGSDDVAIHAVVGIDTYFEASTVADDAALAPAVEIINLGTNDARRIGSPWMSGSTVIEPAQTVDDITGRLDTFAAEFPPTTCVVFVTVNTHNPSWGAANAQAIDDHIRVAFPHVADWDAAWSASDFDTPDNPHPNEVGRQALLSLEDAAIAGCAPPA
jgi:lysophospholipase L1-like esterase